MQIQTFLRARQARTSKRDSSTSGAGKRVQDKHRLNDRKDCMPNVRPPACPLPVGRSAARLARARDLYNSRCCLLSGHGLSGRIMALQRSRLQSRHGAKPLGAVWPLRVLPIDRVQIE